MQIRRYLVVICSMLMISINAQFNNYEIKPQKTLNSVNCELIEENLSIYTFSFTVEDIKEPIQIVWHSPAIDMHIVHSSGSTEGVGPDWASQVIKSKATSNAPVVSLINNTNQNKLTYAASDGLNSVRFHAGIVEETAEVMHKIVIHPSAFIGKKSYIIEIRIDQRVIPFWQALNDVVSWWESFEGYELMKVPEIANHPMYSTWYSFHQLLNVDEILRECRLAKSLGCESVIVDDGWQTNDNNRGYKYTGDWQPERIPHMKAFVDSVHAIGMKFLLWYSVPFVGTGSDAYDLFKDKLLTTKPWSDSYVLDPRYPEVREYLINIYEKAMLEWNLDGFKLDFVNAFKSSPSAKVKDSMDYSNVDMAVDRLLTDVSYRLQSIKKDILIEFRQPYVGPLMRKYGNMFRATDCPYSIIHNRVRTSQVKLLAGNTATYSDMIMWHPEAPVEEAALQLLNVIFSVPQISVRLSEYPPEHSKMIRFWLSFWEEYRDILIEGQFEAYYPQLNYPVLISKADNKMIAGVYSGNTIVSVDCESIYGEICIINATGDNMLTMDLKQDKLQYNYTIFNCIGDVVESGVTNLDELKQLEVPKSGLIKFIRQ